MIKKYNVEVDCANCAAKIPLRAAFAGFIGLHD